MTSQRNSIDPAAATILNVNDSEAGRVIKSRILGTAGYRVIEAETGMDALRLAHEAKPQLVLLDLKLPDIDGLEVCRSLKGDKATASIMVVLISALVVQLKDKGIGLQEVADGYLVEPVEPVELLATVRALLRLYRSEERLRSFAQELETRVEERTQELVQSQSRLRALAAELNLIEQRERKRLAGELHDYLAQLLVLGCLKLGQVRRAGLPANVDETVKQTEDVLNRALRYSRSLMAELSPTVLQEHGLPAGLRWFGKQMQEHGLLVKVEVGNTSSLSLPEDCAMLLFQAVRELLMNVLKHAGSHEAVVRLQQDEQNLRIEVQDNGIGFDHAGVGIHHDTSLSSQFGLFSIRERMAALGGWLDVQSAPDEGTTATLVLPLPNTKAPSSEFKGLSTELSDQVRNSELNTQHSGLHQKNATIRVLLVDDHAMVRQGLRSVLDSYTDIEVVGEAWNGETAVRAVDSLHPSIVLMDINMPKMNGIEATALIKAHHPEIVVIGLSVNNSGENETAMKQAGAAMLLTKEAAVDELYQVIRESLVREQS